ncbi:hypothetical protein INT45_003610 [Circinella minor]|uniref:F-box domain-containing protein n=1 Tax=Circinella minor TaxID=1195481 RepID=A0A8H7VKQ9_9FUNG|nr:hypothetical protein INT45_003610 [Circinella minor]
MNQSNITHVGLLEKLPYDIISNIFLYLDQQDCLNCMATCRDWYDLIPQFTQANWKTIQLNSDGMSQYQERNLGKHVKHVKFDGIPENELSTMMQKLLDFECTEIESLEFVGCSSGTIKAQQTIFLSLLRRLASHQLTLLDMKRHNWDFSMLDLLFVCPHLTYFSFQAFVKINFSGELEAIQLLPSDRILYNNLIYLHVNADSRDIRQQIYSIICRSPNLRFFIGGDTSTCYTGSHKMTSPELVLSRCPKLEYYVGDGSYESRDEPMRGALIQSAASSLSTILVTNHNKNKNSSIRSDNNDGERQNALQYFSVADNWNASQIIFILHKYKDTLKHVKFGMTSSLESPNGPDGWIHIFQTISLQQLCTLHCDMLDYSIESIVTLLNTCYGTIQEVRLQSFQHEPTILDAPALQRLQILPQLQTLSITNVTFVDESFMLLLERLPSLENLTFRRDKPFTLPVQAAPLLKNLRYLTLEIHNYNQNETPFVQPLLVNPSFFVSLAQCGSKLKCITLKSGNYVAIPFIILDALATLPLLKVLDVNAIGHYSIGKRNEEKLEQHMVKFLNTCLGFDNNINSNITKVASSTTIKILTLRSVSKLTFTILNILGDFTNLENLHISLDDSIYRDNNQSLAGSVKTCLNLDLCGVLDLLRKSKKLKNVVFEEVVSFNYLSSYYLKKKLVEQQQTNLHLRKFIVKPGDRFYSVAKNIKYEDSVKIINTHYQ